MKRLAALSLALVMALSLAACGGKTPAAGSVSTTSYDDLKGKLKEAYALTGGSTNCTGFSSVYTFDKDGKLVSTKIDYDTAVSDDGTGNTAQDAADGSISASN